MKLKNIIKSAVKAKVATAKAKAKAKVAAKLASKASAKCKGGKCCDGGSCRDNGKCSPCAITLALVVAATLCGCKMGEQPTDQKATQRAQTATTYVYIYDNARATFGSDFVSQMQANETSGTETQTSTPTSKPISTPTVDTKPDVDLNYNGPTKTASDGVGEIVDAVANAVSGDDCPNCKDK